jgi:hypothetical protein
MMELALPYKSTHREAVTQKVFPNEAFGLPNGGYYAPNGKFGFPSEEDVHLPIPVPDGS